MKQFSKHNFIIMPKLSKRGKIFGGLLFALVSAGLVFVLQSGLYLSNAKSDSGEILGVATVAYEELNNATRNLSEEKFDEAAQLFESASNNVQVAQDKLDAYKPLTWVHPEANSANHLLEGAQYLAQAGEKLTQSLNLLNELKVSSKGVETVLLNQKLISNIQLFKETKDLLDKSATAFDDVGSIPLDYEDTLSQAKKQVSQLSSVLDKLIGLESLYLNIFGNAKTYLLIFQNYDEQRATGGFIGTYGVLKTENGSIAQLKIDSIYDLDGKIYELVAAPGPFQPDIKRWGIRDANWFVDFPTSARKILDFYEKGEQTADGVMSFTPKIFENLLELTGPIEMKDYGVTLTAENFQEIVQYKTSIDYDVVENEPKKMLADFAPILLDRLSGFSNETWLNFMQIMQNNLDQRHIMVYSKEAETQKIIENLGFSGKVLSTQYDYLSINNSNLGGTKTDLEIDQKANLRSKILSDGSVLNTLSITRTNPTTQMNRSFVRILVPIGSDLIASEGFDNDPVHSSSADGLEMDPDLAAWDNRIEAGKTEFVGWFKVDGNNEKTISLTYMLPFKVSSTYSLLVQKQAGSKPVNFEANLNLGNRQPAWISPRVYESINALGYQSDTNTDDFFGVVFK